MLHKALTPAHVSDAEVPNAYKMDAVWMAVMSSFLRNSDGFFSAPERCHAKEKGRCRNVPKDTTQASLSLPCCLIYNSATRVHGIIDRAFASS